MQIRSIAFAVIALATAACASPEAASADEFTAARPELIHACVAAAAHDEAALKACKGRLAVDCIATDGPSTMSEALCWDREAQTWAEVMNAVLVRLSANDAVRADQLGRSQQAWRAWVEIECDYRGAGFGGGSGAQPAMARCAADLTAERAVSLMLEEAAL